jgi:hypothetical protein
MKITSRTVSEAQHKPHNTARSPHSAPACCNLPACAACLPARIPSLPISVPSLFPRSRAAGARLPPRPRGLLSSSPATPKHPAPTPTRHPLLVGRNNKLRHFSLHLSLSFLIRPHLRAPFPLSPLHLLPRFPACLHASLRLAPGPLSFHLLPPPLPPLPTGYQVRA